MKGDRDTWTWAGLAVVGAAAAIMSFAAVSDLAEKCGVTSRPEVAGVELRVSWLLPIAVDVLAGVATRVWLKRRSNDEAIRVARRAAWAAIGTTIVLNGLHGLLQWAGVAPPWWAAVGVAAVPAVALGAMVHLAVLVGRGPDPAPLVKPEFGLWSGLLDDLAAEAWDRPVGAWLTAVREADRAVPSRDEPDEVLVADLRQHLSQVGGLISRKAVMNRYRIGADRASAIRTAAEQSDDETAAQVA